MGLLDVFKPKRLESIVAAGALEYQGERFLGRVHAEAYEKLTAKYPDADINKVREGFVTSTGRFITDRREATKIADRAGQINKEDKHNIDTYEGGSLASEYLNK